MECGELVTTVLLSCPSFNEDAHILPNIYQKESTICVFSWSQQISRLEYEQSNLEELCALLMLS